MGKRERGVAAQDSGDKAKNKKRQTQQNGSARRKPHSTPTTTTDNSSNTAEAAGAGEEAVAMDPALSKGKGKGGGDKMTAPGQKEEGHKEGNDGGGGAGGSSNRKRKKREHEEEGYEGPVEEEDSGSDDSSQGGDGSEDDSDDSDDEIKLDGALSRRSDAEEGDQEDEEEEEEEEEQDAGGKGAGAAQAGDEQTVVDVCLDFCDPHERFFHGIKALVGHSYLQDATGAGLSSLVDIAVAQGAVGTVLSTDSEDGAVFGFVTALPLRYLSKEHQCVQAVIKYLLEKASKAGRGSEMKGVLGEGAQGKVGLLVSERMINCPMQAVPKLHEALVEDIAWAVENEISEEHREKFRFDKFIVVAPCDDAGGAAGSGPAMLSDFYFSKFDDEVLLQEADFFFSMACTPQSSGGGATSGVGGGSQQRYVVGVLPANKFGECVQGVAQMVG